MDEVRIRRQETKIQESSIGIEERTLVQTWNQIWHILTSKIAVLSTHRL